MAAPLLPLPNEERLGRGAQHRSIRRKFPTASSAMLAGAPRSPAAPHRSIPTRSRFRRSCGRSRCRSACVRRAGRRRYTDWPSRRRIVGVAGRDRFIPTATRLVVDPAVLALRMAVDPDRSGRTMAPGARQGTRIGGTHRASIAGPGSCRPASGKQEPRPTASLKRSGDRGSLSA
jgi:hypothetical protein